MDGIVQVEAELKKTLVWSSAMMDTSPPTRSVRMSTLMTSMDVTQAVLKKMAGLL